ncbi:hypothetical protein G5V58_13350 [Nocardioides anomalus]|uniref:Uncharacterized protein n=1 Tax=Nocardioides anomalus TaxID=2712223 RepID=A0A6G6WEN3_9ACTN|nr:hypothetical protein [Nocardioides anomalus]QIG43613.1 hypothetical protein G5V58_13350 [Nocardioides anomalus]
MSTHSGPAVASRPGLDRFCEGIETHGSTIAMALLWLVPVLAFLVALLSV